MCFVCISTLQFVWPFKLRLQWSVRVVKISRRPEMRLPSSGIWCDVTGMSFFLEPYALEYLGITFLRKVWVWLLKHMASYRERKECVIVSCIRGCQNQVSKLFGCVNYIYKYTQYLDFIAGSLYMFRVLSAPIIRSTINCSSRSLVLHMFRYIVSVAGEIR
jgi:hypothetical protein